MEIVRLSWGQTPLQSSTILGNAIPPLIELSAEPLPKSCISENCIDGQFSFDGIANGQNFNYCSIAMVARINSEFQTALHY